MRRSTLTLTVLSTLLMTASAAQAQKKPIKLPAKPVAVKPQVVKPQVIKPQVIKPQLVKQPVVKTPVINPHLVKSPVKPSPVLTAPPVLKAPIAPKGPIVSPQVIAPQPTMPNGPMGQPRQLIISNPGQPNQLAYFSNRLGARFLVEQMYLPQFGTFWGARVVSTPAFGSPLQRLGLEAGDVITRLDGVPITSYEQLERHILETGVRFMKAGSTYVYRKTVYIYPNHYYPDPYAAEVCEHGFPIQYGQVSVRP